MLSARPASAEEDSDLVSVERRATSSREFDGIICFGGEDWWYHNRGHYDMQMMRELSALAPVLYVNSVGMRVPRVSEGRMFFRRVARKLSSWRRGLVSVRDGFCVLSATAVPGQLGRFLSSGLAGSQMRRAARSLGLRKPLVWVACPTAEVLAERISCVARVYQRTDRYECLQGVDREHVQQCDRRLKSSSDLTVFCSTLLHEEEGGGCRRAVYVDHGVDFERFSAAGDDPSPDPEDLTALPRPRAGFVGAIDAHTFDPELFLEVARRLPDVQFLLVGPCSLPERWCNLPNVHLLGQRPYEEVARYMASCDVLLMPWNQSDWIRACNPIKLKEYLAVGRPVVTTPFEELQRYEGYVTVARNGEEFAEAVRDALTGTPEPRALRERVRNQSWGAKAGKVLSSLEELGIVVASTGGTRGS